MGAAVKHKSKTSWPVVIYFIFAFATMCAEQIAERREAKGPPDGGASPLVSLIHPDAGKARGE